jgi:WD40 repeat protein
VEFSPDGRWLASAGWDSHFFLWDVATGREVARQVDGPVEIVSLLWEPEGSLLTYSGSGLRRWPVRPSPAGSKPELNVGPAQLLLPPVVGMQGGRLSLFGDEQRLLAGCSYRQGSFDVMELGNPVRKLWTRQRPHLDYISGSPDGRWVATGTFEGGSGVCVWDRRSGELVKEWPIGDAEVAFSPDGRWLAATTGRLSAGGAECRTWCVGSWEPGPRVPLERMTSSPPALAFTSDGRVLAVVHGTSEVRLLDADTLEDIAILVPPDPMLITRLTFSPDDNQLAVAANNYVQLWDLRPIRAGLKELGLDWDAPP